MVRLKSYITQIINKHEPPHGKTNNLHRQKQRRRSASRYRSDCWFSHEAAHIKIFNSHLCFNVYFQEAPDF